MRETDEPPVPAFRCDAILSNNKVCGQYIFYSAKFNSWRHIIVQAESHDALPNVEELDKWTIAKLIERAPGMTAKRDVKTHISSERVPRSINPEIPPELILETLCNAACWNPAKDNDQASRQGWRKINIELCCVNYVLEAKLNPTTNKWEYRSLQREIN